MATALRLKEGKLYRYGSEGGLLSFKKCWKECYAVLNGDGVMKLYKDHTMAKELAEINFDLSVLWLTFGKDAEKLQPPKTTSSEDAHTAAVLESKNYIAVPKDKTRDTIVWLAAENADSLRLWIRAIALGVKDRSKPPIVGANRRDYPKLLQQIRDHFQIDEQNAEDWEIYWLYSVIGGDLRNFVDAPAPPETSKNGAQLVLRKTRSNLEGDPRDEDEEREEPGPFRVCYTPPPPLLPVNHSENSIQLEGNVAIVTSDDDVLLPMANPKQPRYHSDLDDFESEIKTVHHLRKFYSGLDDDEKEKFVENRLNSKKFPPKNTAFEDEFFDAVQQQERRPPSQEFIADDSDLIIPPPPPPTCAMIADDDTTPKYNYDYDRIVQQLQLTECKLIEGKIDENEPKSSSVKQRFITTIEIEIRPTR